MPRIFLAFQKNKKCLPNQTTKLIKPIDPKFRATELKPCRPKKKKKKTEKAGGSEALTETVTIF